MSNPLARENPPAAVRDLPAAINCSPGRMLPALLDDGADEVT